MGEDEKLQLSLNDILTDLSQMESFLSITDTLKKHDISFISLKGPLLSQRIYKETTHRKYRDFDFLLNPIDAEKAYFALIDIGYLPYSMELPRDNLKKKKFLEHIHDIPLYNKSNNVTVEIHTKLLRYEHLEKKLLDQIIQANLTEIKLAARSFQVLDTELELLYLVIHGGLHRFTRLKWLVDIKDFLTNIPIDPEKFQNLTIAFNAQKLVGLCNEVLKIYFPKAPLLTGHPKPNKRIISYVLKTIENENDEKHKGSLAHFIRFMYFTITISPGWRYKLSVVYNHLYLSYTINSKTNSKTPLFIHFLKVPFQTALRWLKNKRNSNTF
jgi:hypothetical protein